MLRGFFFSVLALFLLACGGHPHPGHTSLASDPCGVTYYLDPAAGSDANDGLSPSTAWQTGVHYEAVVGDEPELTCPLDLYVENSLPNSDSLLFSGRLASPAARLRLHGVPSVIASGTLTNVVYQNQTTGQPDELTDSSVTDWSPYVGDLVQITHGTTTIRTYVLKALTGPARARVSWYSVRDPTNVYWANVVVPSVGDPYQVLTLPTIPNFIEDVSGFVPSDISQASSSIEFVRFTDGSSNYYVTLDSPAIVYDSILPSVATANNDSSFINCQFGLLSTGAYTSIVHGVAINGAVIPSAPVVAFGMMLESSQIVSFGGSFEIHHVGYGMGVFDTDSAIQFSGGGTFIVAASIWGGAGDTTSLVDLSEGARMVSDYAYTVKYMAACSGCASDVRFVSMTGGYLTTAPAVDPTTNLYTTPRTLTFAHLRSSVASGGFGGNAFEPFAPSTAVVAP